MTDVELDERVTALEENGGGDSDNGKVIKAERNFTRQQFQLELEGQSEILNFFYISDTIAFHLVLTSYDTISEESVVLFKEILLNEGEG